MKKFFILLIALAISALTVMTARTLYVEKALNVSVKVDDKKMPLKAGASLDEDTKISMPNDGVLVVVDKASGKRWLVKKKFSGKVGKVAREKDKSIVTTTKSLFYTYSQPNKDKKKDKKAGVTVIGGNVGNYILGSPCVRVGQESEKWKNDSTYRFLNDIEADTISYILVE